LSLITRASRLITHQLAVGSWQLAMGIHSRSLLTPHSSASASTSASTSGGGKRADLMCMNENFNIFADN